MNLNDVKAGKYQLVAPRWDKITSEPGKPLTYVRYRKGDIVDLDETDAKRLVAAGAVVKPGQLERTAAEQAKAVAERALADYNAVLAGLPEDVRKDIAPGTVPATGGGDGTADGGTGEDGESKPSKVEAVKAEVGDDVEKAKAALEAELALDDKDQRSTLVKHLQKIIAAGAES